MGTRSGGSGRGGKYSGHFVPDDLREATRRGSLDATAFDAQGRYHVFHGTIPGDKVFMHIRGMVNYGREIAANTGSERNLPNGKAHPLWNPIPAKYIVGVTRF
jgi:hypothetical protein